ncbi:hypothetical protein K458DRAFT_102288 [Lentithecium fluviatile CBS 122367]|uniref:Uncharacterized protein n=1 Tax=Lentithecium fluviatile CBS 122367 TaxID=1168545 RepID=A0A6G1JII0_9PLEO|nr:hypothetical protein K458DRAFT_102288 [Lentithecium fluviatile CBS 122367]
MGSKSLLTYEPYLAYTALVSLPPYCSEFEKNGNSEYIVQPGEIFCRACLIDGDTELCGKRFAERGALIHHLKKYHHEYNVAPAKTGRSDFNTIREAKVFYKGLMAAPSRLGANNPPTTPGVALEQVQNTLEISSTAAPAPTQEVPAQTELPTRKRKRKVTVVAPTDTNKPELLQAPVYKTNNVKRNQKKGEVKLTIEHAIRCSLQKDIHHCVRPAG